MFLKRFLDIAVSFLGLLILSPAFLLIAVLVYFKLGNPILFTQKRPGLKGKPFRMIKFRTLTNEKDDQGHLLPDEKRLTRIGSFLRSASLDELPGLINVLIGNMSLVGPRPLRVYYLPLYNEFQMRRHEFRPGITGWAQINGRNTLNWEERFKLDVWYIDNWSLWLDIKILFFTLLTVVKRENTTATDGGFTEPFKGTGKKKVSDAEIHKLKKLDDQT